MSQNPQQGAAEGDQAHPEEGCEALAARGDVDAAPMALDSHDAAHDIGCGAVLHLPGRGVAAQFEPIAMTAINAMQHASPMTGDACRNDISRNNFPSRAEHDRVAPPDNKGKHAHSGRNEFDIAATGDNLGGGGNDFIS